MPLVTYMRCKTCGVEQTVIGPYAIATYQSPGWSISESEFYNPNGVHYCKAHRIKVWNLYCEDFDCGECHGWSMGTEVEALESLSMAEVKEQYADWTCPNGNPIMGVEDIVTGETYSG